MDSTEVIDIDELLGDAPTKESLETAEEYDFEGFLDDALLGVNTKGTSDEVDLLKTNSRNDQDKKQKDKKSSDHNGNPKSTSHASHLSSSSNRNNSGKDMPSSDKTRTTTGGRISLDGVMTPNAQKEAMLDVISLNSGASQDMMTVSEDDLVFDVNSEELKQFILEFQEENKKVLPYPPDLRTRNQGAHRDDDSLSSLSTCESHDDSLSSSLASGDYQVSPDRVKLSKAAKGKSVRFLMSSLLNKNRTQPPDMLGSEDDESKQDAKNKNKTRTNNKKKMDEKSKTTPSPRKETSSSADKLRQILGEGDWEKKLKVNGLQHSTSIEAEAEATSPRESSLPKQALQAAIKGDQQILEFLLLANRELSVVRDGRGNTLLHTVCKRGHLDCLKWLATGFCSSLLTMENDDCFTPADLAVKHGHLECLGWLVQETECKSELHPQDNRWSLLHVAARFGQEECLRWLLSYMQVADIPIELIDHNDNTPAHLAAKYGHLTCLQTLVEFNADITMTNKKKQTPCILATKYHHETCAQFLVVVETCITLSEQVMTLQRQLRESHEERRVLKHKLKDTLSCTEALVKMHKATDTLERVQQVRTEYVDLTNLLVKRLDTIHLEKKASEDDNDDKQDDTLAEVRETKRKAAELEQACQNLLEEEEKRRQGDHQDNIQQIEDQLGNIVVPKSPRPQSWPSQMDDPTSTLDRMRARLSEVSHGLTIQGPSLSEESVDNLSLSSSYASSLSSSCSSLTTLMRSNGSLRGSRRRRVTWTDEVGQTGEVVVTLTGVDGQRSKTDNTLHPPPPYAKISSRRPHLQKQKATTEQPPSSPESDNTSSPLSSKQTTHTPHVQYDRSQNPGKLGNLKQHWSSSESSLYEPREGADSRRSSKDDGNDTDARDSGKCDVAMPTGVSSGMVQGGDGVDLLASSQNHTNSNYVNVNTTMLQNRTHNDTVSRPDRTHVARDDKSKTMQRAKSESDMRVRNQSNERMSVRVEMGKKLHARALSADQLLQGCPSPPTPFKKDSQSNNVEQGKDVYDENSSEDEDDPFGSQNVLAMQEAMQRMRPAPVIEKTGNSTENLHLLFAKHLPPQKYKMITNVPEYRRNRHKILGRTNGENVHPNSRHGSDGENGAVPPHDFGDKRGQTLKTLNSDDSMSSTTSSNATWSESDQQDPPSPDRPTKRAGILNTGKKSGDGKKCRSDKHITFALDTDLGEKDSNRKSAISKRRDLSPIYETPDLLRLSRNGDSVLRQNILAANRTALSGGDRSGERKNGDSGKTLEERLYRLFSYSSDDDNESSYSEESLDHGRGGHIARKDQHKPGMRMPSGLSDEISPEFEAMPPSPEDHTNTNGPRMWYESSEEDEEEDEEAESSNVEEEDNLKNSTGSFDRHICYL